MDVELANLDAMIAEMTASLAETTDRDLRKLVEDQLHSLRAARASLVRALPELEAQRVRGAPVVPEVAEWLCGVH